MKVLLQQTLLFLLASLNLAGQSDIIKNGKYIVHLKTNGYSDYGIVFRNDSYYKIIGNDTIKGQIKWLSKNTFILLDKIKNPVTDSTDLAKILHDSFGEKCIEVMTTDKGGFKFRTTYVGQLHITINEGEFIKQKK